MKFAGWQKESFIDYPGKISTLVFTSGCNYNCGYCHNPDLKNSKSEIDEKEIFDYALKNKEWIDAIVISGGEPTLKPELKNFAKKAKDLGFLVKLDTNGSNADVLQNLKEQNLIDYVAMDVKGPLNLYPNLIGRNFIEGKEREISNGISKGIVLISEFPDYEFRTTLAPIYENGKARWINPEEIRETAELINKLSNENSKYYLQKFVSREKGNIMDEKFSKDYLPKEMWETPKEHLEECLIEAKKYLNKVSIRN